MVDRKLVAYVREQLHRGYSLASIKTVLMQSGYDSHNVNRTLRSVRYRSLFIGIVVFLVLSLAVGFIFSLASLVDYGTSPIPLRDLSSISDEQTSLKDRPTITNIISSPQERVANSNFRIILNDTSTLPSSQPVLDTDFRDIVQLAHENPQKARRLCIDLSSLTDSCLLASGLATSKSEFCVDINDGDKRDSCYFNIVVAAKEHQLCASITNPHLRDACVQLS